jgi:molybdate transport system regulatory protein
MRPKIRPWIVFPTGTKIGEGRAALLRLVATEGSLKRAVERLGMSYRAAWGYIRELEEAAGFRFLRPAGHGRGAGTRLTRKGEAFLDSFDRFRAALDDALGAAFRRAFNGPGSARGARRRSSRRRGGTRRG